MKRTLLILLGILLLVGAVFVLTASTEDVIQEPAPAAPVIPSTIMRISSDFSHEGRIDPSYTCDADNVSPPLEFHDVPEETVSLVLIVDDPDAPVGTWNHWTMWNIDPMTTHVATDSSPSGVVEGVTSFGTAGYGGPCPPSGEHRYFFALYALDSTLVLGPDADVATLREAMEGHVIGSAELIGLYSR